MKLTFRAPSGNSPVYKFHGFGGPTAVRASLKVRRFGHGSERFFQNNSAFTHAPSRSQRNSAKMILGVSRLMKILTA